MKHALALLLLLLVAGCDSSSLEGSAIDGAAPGESSETNPGVRAQAAPVLYRVTGDWGSGFGAELVITNTATTTMSGWTVEFDAPFTIDSLWNAHVAPRGAGYRLTPESWNSSIAPGRSITIGFNGRPGGPPASPTNITLNGQSVSDPTPAPTGTPAPTLTSTPAPAPTPPASGAVQLSSAITSDWGSGFGATVSVRNTGNAPLTDWKLRFDLSKAGANVVISSIWNVEVLSRQGTTVTVGPVSWNRTIAPGAKIEFGFNGSPGGAGISGLALISPSGFGDPSPAPSPSPTSTPTPTPDPQPTPPPSSDGQGPGLVAYFAEWGVYDRNYHVSNIPAASVDVINYAFAQVVNGEVALFDSYAAVEKSYPGDSWDQPLRGNFNQLAKLKASNPKLKTMISVGGWTLSGSFSDLAMTEASRQKFALSAVAFIKRYGFDGVDIDWEYPVGGGEAAGRPVDKANYTLLLKELRRRLDAQGALDGKRYLLSIAAPAGSDKIANLEVRAIGETVDWINVMTYDLHGSWENVTNHHAPLRRNPQDPTNAALGYTVDSAIAAYLNAGVPASKVVMGIPAYGHSWKGSTGLFKPATGAGPGSWEAGKLDYKDLVTRQASQPSLYQRIWDAAAQAPVQVAPSLNGLVVSYEDPQSLAAKIAFAREQKLGGFMLWELSGDVADTSRADSLVGVMARALQTWP